MESAKQIHHVKLDSSGRLLIPSVRIPSDADQRSEMMAIAVPN